MEILDPDLWNDDGTPKRPSREYMAGLEAVQAHGEGLMRVVDTTTPVAATEKRIVDGAFMDYARIKREAQEQRQPQVGDIVHALDVWEGEGPEREAICRAAIVMETDGVTTELRVHIPRKPFEDWAALHDEHKAGMDTWHWPCGDGQ